MEFAMGLTFSVPKYRREMDPDAEHTALMHDMQYIIEADKCGFKYGLVAEHHFLSWTSIRTLPPMTLSWGISPTPPSAFI